MKKDHALLSASSSKRWLSCPPSARLEENYPKETSIYAEEGTLAHFLAETFINYTLGNIEQTEYCRKMEEMTKHHLYSKEMAESLETYIDFALEKINEAKAKTKDAVVLLEQKLDFSPWVSEGFGTGDLVIITDSILEIIDLKYGKGVTVEAENNTQMRLYGLGAIHHFGCLYDINTVKMTICQPRLDHISTEEMTAEELLNWGETFVKPRAQIAINGEGEFKVGEHCRFCRVRFTCRKRAEENLEIAKHDFKNPSLLSDEEISEVLKKSEELKRWTNDVYEYALKRAVNEGKKWDGFKLVEGRSVRKYCDEEKAAKILIEAGYKEDAIFSKKLLGISKLEKVLGKRKFKELLGEYVIKPEGKPTLVCESDKRVEMNLINKAIEDFK
ncbi:DUF2800 domain-containing protein [Caminicella sporogenes]|uniref:DUF2800 domain-containing protein n=1 Tax=Caminicella sporogenes TaxID=166485 RepID=UPI0025415415|nr:DUF2800 domain-containing protein [Caminicella sporogenes]WIF95091.1 DUF2800 domain-containing protein [Caminicella sporogenes]